MIRVIKESEEPLLQIEFPGSLVLSVRNEGPPGRFVMERPVQLPGSAPTGGS
jgi:hypothetical protein